MTTSLPIGQHGHRVSILEIASITAPVTHTKLYHLALRLRLVASTLNSTRSDIPADMPNSYDQKPNQTAPVCAAR